MQGIDPQAERRRAILRKVIAEQGDNLTAWSRDAGVNESTVRSFLEGRSNSMTAKTYEKLARARPGLTVAYLIGEEHTKRTVAVAGYVGAGDRVFTFDGDTMDGALEEIDIDIDPGEPVEAVIVRGNSQYPSLFDRDIIVYRRDPVPPDTLIGKQCVVRLADGRTLVKTIRRGSAPGFWNLESFNAPPEEDVVIERAVPVRIIVRG